MNMKTLQSVSRQKNTLANSTTFTTANENIILR